MGVCTSTPVEPAPINLWEDRQIKWDVTKNQLEPRQGEVVCATFNKVEDTKDNNPKCNISIGLGTINYIHINMLTSKCYGRLRAPYIMTQFKGSRFEFTFSTPANDENMKLFGVISKYHRAYRATRVFRDLVLRDEMLIKEGELNILPGENVVKFVPTCENLTTDDSFKGRMWITNLRVVWAANEPANVNVSVPYLQLKSCSSRNSTRHGLALVLETSELSGNYTLGFKTVDNDVPGLIELINKNTLATKRNPNLGPTDANIRVENDRLVLVSPPTPQEEAEETRRHAEQTSRPDAVHAALTSRNNPGSTSSALAGALAAAADAGERARQQPGVALPNGAASARRGTMVNVITAPPPDAAEAEADAARPAALSPQSKRYVEGPMKCVVCWSESVNAAFDPCGHLSVCKGCADLLVEKKDGCPVCRQPIGKVLQIFMVGN